MEREAQAEFEWLFRAAYPSVFRSVCLITRDPGRAEEVCQDAFTQLFKKWHVVSYYEHPDAWVRKVAVRMAVRQVGRDRRRTVLQRTIPVPVAVMPTSDLELSEALGSLTAMQRAAVVLYYYEDRPVLEVARLLQVSGSTVKQHLHRARARLAETLGEEVVEDVR